MPSRSIQVKLIVPRGDQGLSLRQSMQETHVVINEETKYYEKNLLLMRGDSYVTPDDEVDKEIVITELRELIKSAKARNRVSDDSSDE